MPDLIVCKLCSRLLETPEEGVFFRRRFHKIVPVSIGELETYPEAFVICDRCLDVIEREL